MPHLTDPINPRVHPTNVEALLDKFAWHDPGMRTRTLNITRAALGHIYIKAPTCKQRVIEDDAAALYGAWQQLMENLGGTGVQVVVLNRTTGGTFQGYIPGPGELEGYNLQELERLGLSDELYECVVMPLLDRADPEPDFLFFPVHVPLSTCRDYVILGQLCETCFQVKDCVGTICHECFLAQERDHADRINASVTGVQPGDSTLHQTYRALVDSISGTR